jgi:hypothetical protein
VFNQDSVNARPARSRRSLLTAAAAAGGALATQALVRPAPVEAASVVLGAVNSATAATTIRTTQALSSAKAIVGLVTHSGAGPSTAGVQGQSNAQGGNGVFGVALTGAGAKGAWGRSANGTGVFGEATATSGVNYGVQGTTRSNAGVGVFGAANAGPGVTGVLGRTLTGTGVHGHATSTAVGGFGVRGTGLFGVAGRGYYAVIGEATLVYGLGSAYAIYGNANAAAAFAGYFNGKTHVNGVLTKSSGSFLIDHPLDPANRTLEHSFVEAPEMLNVYGGTARLDANGRARIRLPHYFAALNGDCRYQLTAVGLPAPNLHVAGKVEHNSFRIAGGAPGQEVCWLVTGIRQDAWATAHPVRVERAKRRRDRGKYLNPEVFGEPRSASLHSFPKVSQTPRPRRHERVP